ncbi:MerR family transcriptional regulator [Streptomyces sp. NBC_00083]|uniref:MerR family transcriptional regulator n=1 Tax=Streptomyces sp. NBC_00083 TaxID=2975647 RepID=UPI00225B4FA9|nr:MerR family transcriptional regulator [Streptomyces sp. NBC_00083]MCX5382766.1 MerR family transcriptional regulator [Streptomyces sp. NBC_00083]
MRISEIAALAGVTTRAVRHYHHLGLLPEPERLANGYRRYSVRDAVALARIRRLTELGLGLDEVRDVIDDDAGHELADVLRELDGDLARQETRIQARRARLAELLARAEHGPLSADDEFSPELADLFAELGADPAGSAMAAKDREVLALLTAAADPEERDRLLAAVRSTAAAPGAAGQVREVYALLDALADADPSDPRVDEAARALAACLPPELEQEISAHASADPAGQVFLRAFLADLAPAQAEAVRRAMSSVTSQRGGTAP